MHLMTPARILFLLSPLCLAGSAAAQDYWHLQKSGTDASFRGVSVASISSTLGRVPVPAPVVWVSGSKGTILRSVDQGETWNRVSPPDASDLDFRGIVAFDEKTAYAMSSGEGAKSRIYKTADGGKTWKLQLAGDRKEFFLDSVACASDTLCIALGDPIDGKFNLLRTTDGEHWSSFPRAQIPDALPGEGSFAASNSCLLIRTAEDFFFVTGGTSVEGKGGRVFHTTDSGKSWTTTEPPIARGNTSSGIFAIATDFDNKQIIVVGGDYKQPGEARQIAAYSEDNGKTWISAKDSPHGFRSAVAAITATEWIAVGPTGTDVSNDAGKHWHSVDKAPLNAVALRNNSGWAVGPGGAIARYVSKLELM